MAIVQVVAYTVAVKSTSRFVAVLTMGKTRPINADVIIILFIEFSILMICYLTDKIVK